MKGFAVSPVVLLIVFVIVIALSFHVRNADSNSVRALSAEGEARKAMVAADKELSKAAAVAFETLYSENKINPLTDMEDKIAANLLARGMDASIKIGAGGNKITQVNITPNNFGIQQGNSIVTLTSTSSFLLTHPFFQYSQTYENYDPNQNPNICDYAVDCDLAQYAIDKGINTGFTWTVTGNCVDPGDGSTVITYQVTIKDPDNYVTWAKPFELDNKKNLGNPFSVKC